MRVPVLGLFSLFLRWAKTCLTRWQHCLHSLFCWFLAQLCLKLCPHWSPHLPVRRCDVGHSFLHKCTEQYNLNVDLRVQVTQNCPQRYVHRVCCCGWPSPRWGMLDQSRSWYLPLRDGGHGKGQDTGSSLNLSSGMFKLLCDLGWVTWHFWALVYHL